jgi:hypothetical protein
LDEGGGIVRQVAAEILSLEEPWRERFLEHLAERAGKDGRVPTRRELEAWLQEDLDLALMAARMVRTWRRVRG